MINLNSSNTSASQVNVTLPKPINNDLHIKAEQLPVYTEKKWIPNKNVLEDEEIKDKPSFAKVSVPKQQSKNLTLTVINDKTEPLAEADTNASTGMNASTVQMLLNAS